MATWSDLGKTQVADACGGESTAGHVLYEWPTEMFTSRDTKGGGGSRGAGYSVHYSAHTVQDCTRGPHLNVSVRNILLTILDCSQSIFSFVFVLWKASFLELLLV